MEDEWTHDTMFQLISPMHVFQVISNKKNPAYEILSVAEMSHILSYLLEEKKPVVVKNHFIISACYCQSTLLYII